MRKRERRGWTLAVLLACLILIVAVPIAHTPTHKQSKIVSKQATWKEKRANRLLAKTYASAGYGWRGREWTCLNSLWTSESRFDHYANNPRSSAYGIAQLIGEKDRRPSIQILHGLRYISVRYSAPCRAWKFHIRHNHY